MRVDPDELSLPQWHRLRNVAERLRGTRPRSESAARSLVEQTMTSAGIPADALVTAYAVELLRRPRRTTLLLGWRSFRGTSRLLTSLADSVGDEPGRPDVDGDEIRARAVEVDVPLPVTISAGFPARVPGCAVRFEQAGPTLADSLGPALERLLVEAGDVFTARVDPKPPDEPDGALGDDGADRYFAPPRKPVPIPRDVLGASSAEDGAFAISTWVSTVHGWGDTGSGSYGGRLLYWPADSSWWILQYGQLDVVLLCGSDDLLHRGLPDPRWLSDELGAWLRPSSATEADIQSRVEDLRVLYAPFRQWSLKPM